MTQLSLLSPASTRPQGVTATASVKPGPTESAAIGTAPFATGSADTATTATALTGTGSALSSQTLSGAISVQANPLDATVDLNDPNNEIYKILTPGDVKLIREATGVNLRVVKNLVVPFDDNGNYAPGPTVDIAMGLQANIEGARKCGSLVGDIDAGFAKKLISFAKLGGAPMPLDMQDKMMEAVAKRDQEKIAA